MSELLKNQKFGVEVEFTGITREMAANAVREVVGGTISGPRSDGYRTRVIKDSHRRQARGMWIPFIKDIATSNWTTNFS